MLASVSHEAVGLSSVQHHLTYIFGEARLFFVRQTQTTAVIQCIRLDYFKQERRNMSEDDERFRNNSSVNLMR